MLGAQSDLRSCGRTGVWPRGWERTSLSKSNLAVSVQACCLLAGTLSPLLMCLSVQREPCYKTLGSSLPWGRWTSLNGEFCSRTSALRSALLLACLRGASSPQASGFCEFLRGVSPNMSRPPPDFCHMVGLVQVPRDHHLASPSVSNIKLQVPLEGVLLASICLML